MRTPTVLMLLALLAGCGTATRTSVAAGEPESKPTAIPAADGPVGTRYPALVLGKGDQEAQLCLGYVADSLPPQCSGPPIGNWDWSQHEGDFEQRSGVRWGDFLVTGTFDGRSFTASEVATGEGFDFPGEPLLGTPCPAPDGGWHVVDPATTTEQTKGEVFRAAQKLDGYAAAWVDQSINPAYPFNDSNAEQLANDPTQEIVNVAVTGDVAGAERQLRAIWGGALCVSQHEHTARELERVQAEVNDLPGMQTSGSGDGRDHVTLEVTYDDGSIQRWCDATYGKGTVVVSSALVPVPASG